MTPSPRRLYAPKLVKVEFGDDDSLRAGYRGLDEAASGATVPRAVDGVTVAAVREEWRVEDRWWVPSELQRHYFELALADGRAVVVFRCELSGRWYRQRA